MKKLLIVLIGFVCAANSVSQVKGTILKDEPENMRVYRLRIPVWCIGLSGHNLSIYDAQFGLDIQPSDKFILSADYTIGLGDQIYPESGVGVEYPASGIVVPQTVNDHARQINVAGVYFFKSELKPKEMEITLKGGNITHYTIVPGTELRRFGVRFGARGGSTWYHYGELDVDYNLDQINQTETIQDQSTMLRYSQLRLGLAMAKTTNLWVEAEGYGKRANTGTTLYYLDLMLGMKSEVDDVYYLRRGLEAEDGNTYYYTPIALNDKVEMSKLGYELGMQYFPSASLWTFSVALGRLNGIKGGPNGYLKLGVSLSIGNRIREK